ncbi:hypothetical protein EVG20_g2183 [Dentipellis fragilis]|uniref:XPG-I domain-containing protein n=1 Tax=Dentipellis fragilis TaxID=205917 RepID=A0A4Y9Z7S3_9AGAM|nr:hypothetical protein EVG20_g2183 [Dentipellis fragilis]
MGVPGLWDVLRPAAQTRSLTHLAVVDGFQANPAGLRGLRVGIDASIWFFHAAYGREGENPELRTLFFRCARLMSMPFLPLFVFDGPRRPNIKRGKRITGKDHWLVNGMKEIIEAFGFEWRMAPGEAEAELAYLNSTGLIDAIMSDDVDNFLFGARVVIRNPSISLSGNRSHSLKNSAGKNDGNHSAVFTSDAIATHTSVGLSRGGLILIGLLSGGDYHQAGLPRCGPNIACGLARCGFGDQLLEAANSFEAHELPAFLDRWRESLRHELRTNSKGHLGTKKPSLAKAVDDDFPSIDVLLSYAKPITSENDKTAKRKHVPPKWRSEPDLGKIAHLCEIHFEWGIRDIIIKRFRTVLWPSAILQCLRQLVLETDKHAGRHALPSASTRPLPISSSDAAGTPSKLLAAHLSSMRFEDSGSEDTPDRLVVKIHSRRSHASTDGILEYRLEVAPAELVRQCNTGIQGIRKPADTTFDAYASDLDDGSADGGKDSAMLDPNSHIRVWMPACVVELALPHLVHEFENKAATKKGNPRKARRTERKAPASQTPKKQSSKSISRTFDERHRHSSSDGLEKHILPPTQPSSSSASVSGLASPKSSTFSLLNVRLNSILDDEESSVPVYDLSSDPETISQSSKPQGKKNLHGPANATKKSTATPSIRPFPMAFTDDELGSSEDESDVLPGPLMRPSVGSQKPQYHSYDRRFGTTLPSPSKSSKSPRKPTNHPSPKRRAVPPASDSYRTGSRPSQSMEPSVTRVPTARSKTSTQSATAQDTSVIEISTDSETDDNGHPGIASKIAPLMLARSRAAGQGGTSRKYQGDPTVNHGARRQNNEIIDLT